MKDAAHTEGDGNRSDARAAWQQGGLGPAERALLDRDAAAFLHQDLSTPCLTTVAKAEGIWIEDHSGRRWMDFHGNSVHHIGYGHPRVLAAIRDQLERLSFAPRRFTCEPAVALAEKLATIAPGGGAKKCLFTTGGSDAVEVALKLARAATGRFKTLSFWDAFHGAGFGASSVGGEATFRSGPTGPLLPGAEHVAPFACYRCPYGHAGPEVCGIACAGMVEYVLAREGDIAAVVAEPMRAVPYVAPPGFWTRVREACDRHGTLLIFDEIPTGLGKTGAMFAAEHEGVAPDITDVARDRAIGHYTHEKNPVTARAALETLAVIEDEGLVERADTLGRHARARLDDLAARCPHVGDVRGRGLMLGVEIVADRERRTPDPARAERILYRCLDEGLSFKVTAGSVLTLSPPLTIARADLDHALDIVEAAVTEDAGRA